MEQESKSPPNRKPVRSFAFFNGVRFQMGQEIRIDSNGENGMDRFAVVIDFRIDQDHFNYYREVKRDMWVLFNGQHQVWKSVVGGGLIEHNLL